jgi:hypothetical protein
MYTLILNNGRVMVFSVKECAELYQTIHTGSTLVCNEIFEKEVA